MRISLLLLLILASHALTAQTVITGSAVTFEGQEIHLLTHSDHITEIRNIATRDSIAADGSFRLEFEPKETLPIVLTIGEIEAYLYIRPDQQYDIEFPKLKPGMTDRPEVLIASVKINREGPEEMNRHWRAFKQQYYEYVEANYMQFMKKGMRTKVRVFSDSMRTRYGKVESPYFQELLNYQLAALQMNAGRSKNVLFKEFIAGKPIRYQNDAYMGFFNQFYESNYSNEAYHDSRQLNELIELKRYFDHANTPDSEKQKQQVKELRKLLKNSSYKAIRHIAGNIIRKTNRLSVGNPAPEFTLVDRNGKTIRLQDLRGKYVYLDFWATWCTPCIKEMEVIKQLHKKYGRKVVFLSISVDESPEAMQRFLKKRKYKWKFAHMANQPNIKELYNVHGVPVYYLIDPDGFLVQSPAYRPTGKIEPHLAKVAGTKRGKKSFEEIRTYEDD